MANYGFAKDDVFFSIWIKNCFCSTTWTPSEKNFAQYSYPEESPDKKVYKTEAIRYATWAREKPIWNRQEDLCSLQLPR